MATEIPQNAIHDSRELVGESLWQGACSDRGCVFFFNDKASVLELCWLGCASLACVVKMDLAGEITLEAAREPCGERDDKTKL